MTDEVIEVKKKPMLSKTDKLIIGMLVTIAMLVIMVVSLSLTTQSSRVVPQNISTNMTQAFNVGVITSITQLLNITNDCKVASVTYQNFSRQIVDVACVKQLLIDNNITG